MLKQTHFSKVATEFIDQKIPAYFAYAFAAFILAIIVLFIFKKKKIRNGYISTHKRTIFFYMGALIVGLAIFDNVRYILVSNKVNLYEMLGSSYSERNSSLDMLAIVSTYTIGFAMLTTNARLLSKLTGFGTFISVYLLITYGSTLTGLSVVKLLVLGTFSLVAQRLIIKNTSVLSIILNFIISSIVMLITIAVTFRIFSPNTKELYSTLDWYLLGSFTSIIAGVVSKYIYWNSFEKGTISFMQSFDNNYNFSFSELLNDQFIFISETELEAITKTEDFSIWFEIEHELENTTKGFSHLVWNKIEKRIQIIKNSMRIKTLGTRAPSI